MVSFFRNPFHDTASGGRHDPLSSGQPPVMGAPFPVKAGDQAEPVDSLFAQGVDGPVGDPLSGVVDEPTRLDPQQAVGPSSASLGLFDAPATGRVWLVGAHGGSGCTTICESAPDLFADAGRRLPVNPDVAPQVDRVRDEYGTRLGRGAGSAAGAGFRPVGQLSSAGGGFDLADQEAAGAGGGVASTGVFGVSRLLPAALPGFGGGGVSEEVAEGVSADAAGCRADASCLRE